MKKILAFLLPFILIFTLVGCSSATGSSSPATTSQQALEADTTPIAVDHDPEDFSSASGTVDAYIRLEGDAISLEGSGATVDGSILTITAAGTYSLSGVLNDGQIIVDTTDEEPVVLVLDGVDITSSTSAPIYVRAADKVIISLAEGSENRVTDGTDYAYDDVLAEEPNAAIFSNDDLTLTGGGSLVVNANFNHGIVSQDNLKITGGIITVYAVNDGIKGKNFIAIMDGWITITAGGDGLQSNNDEDAEKGYIAIEGGTLNITAGLDGIQAETRLSISGGTLSVSSGGGSLVSSSVPGGDWGGQRPGMPSSVDATDTPSTKGLKAGVDVTITGGSIQIDSLDDAIHSNDSLTISAGDITIRSSDDGVHADATLTISGGTLQIDQSYEGIESAVITIAGGDIHVVASDDGINASGGDGGSDFGGSRGMDNFTDTGAYSLLISGGYIYVDAGGDGVDINGSITMTAGTLIVNGPTNDGNGALDYLGSFTISGGLLVAVGSSGMATGPGDTSTQYSILNNFTSPMTAGTLVNLQSSTGEVLLTFQPSKQYQSLVFSSPDLENGMTCTIYTGGSSSGTQTDGMYTSGAYIPGSEVISFTISATVTNLGAAGRDFPPGSRP
jgi:hypothetical protein